MTPGLERDNLFLEAVRGTRFYAAHLLAVRRGLRRGEVLGLRWRDIDFCRKTLTVRRSLVVCEGRPVFHKPKTLRSRRTIGRTGGCAERASAESRKISK